MNLYRDSCEDCLADLSRPRSAPAPIMAIADGDDGILAAYRCPACGYMWTCAWSAVPGSRVPPPPLPGLFPELAALLSEQAAVNRARSVLGRRRGAA